MGRLVLLPIPDLRFVPQGVDHPHQVPCRVIGVLGLIPQPVQGSAGAAGCRTASLPGHPRTGSETGPPALCRYTRSGSHPYPAWTIASPFCHRHTSVECELRNRKNQAAYLLADNRPTKSRRGFLPFRNLQIHLNKLAQQVKLRYRLFMKITQQTFHSFFPSLIEVFPDQINNNYNIHHYNSHIHPNNTFYIS